MQIEEKETVIQQLLKGNIPFVIFREPNKEAKLLIQTTPLQRTKDIKIESRGFYAFPFSKQEQAYPLFFSMDYFCDFKNKEELNLEFQSLKLPKVPQQELYEVDIEEYLIDIETYLEAFEKRQIKKAIYSRISTNELNESFDIESFFDKLEQKYLKAFVYAMHIPGDGIWMGASPELLLSYNDGRAKTVALAGTLKIDNNLSAPNWTRKEIDEHRLVEKHIINLCESMDFTYEKSPVRTSNTGTVYHLKSDFNLEVPSNQIVEFLNKLHPTPAISGLPQKESVELIYEVEKHERSYYCGFLGFVDDINRFNFYINLRCMKIVGQTYTLFAGGGITADSDIEKEWEETEVKMSTLEKLMEEEDHKSLTSITM